MESKYITPIVYRACLNLAALITPFMVMISRVYLKYHTVEQVIGGYVLGLLFGYVWWSITKRYENTTTNIITKLFYKLSYFDQFKIIKWLGCENRKLKK